MTDKRKFTSIDPNEAPIKDVHNLLLSGVAPRPIALVSTLSEQGRNNLAPFSFFNAFGANPPYVVFSPSLSGRDGSEKDTLVNLQKIPECVIHVVPHELVEQISLASTAYEPEVDEFLKAGFTAIDSDLVRPKRVLESPFHMECHVEQIIPLGGKPGSGNLVLCRVIKFHVADHLLQDGIIYPDSLDLVGRNSGNYYTRASGAAIFKVNKPVGIGVGIDQLPDHIKASTVLSANNLGQLGGVKRIPDSGEVQAYFDSLRSTYESEQESESKEYWQLYFSGSTLMSMDEFKAKELIEMAACQALALNDVHFALYALLSIGSY